MPSFFKKKAELILPAKQLNYDDLIRKICSKKFSLVVNEIKSDGVLFEKNKDGFFAETIGTQTIRGVMHESYRTDVFIPFEMEVENCEFNELENFGTVYLSKFENKTRPEWWDVGIYIHINDYQDKFLSCLKEMVLHAAVSQNRFVEISVLKNEDSFDKSLSRFKEDGYTNQMTVNGIRLWGNLSIPNTPNFAKHDD